MKYQTTNLQPIKRYPTYQFHADTAQKKLPVSQVFCICVLETLRWLRSRLQKFDSLPADICTPKPENYDDFSTEQLHSFSFSMGIHVDVLYLENRGLWSFHLSEPDAGANLGTPRERAAVNGRIFETDISFLMHKERVEVGIRTICSEPSDSSAPCEVFRPMVVRALAQNPNVGFVQNGFVLDGKPMEICAKGDFAHFAALYQAADFDMPLIVIADSGTAQKTLSLDALNIPDKSTLSLRSTQNDLLHFSGRNVQMNEATSEITKEMHIPPNRWLKRMTGMNRADAGKTESAGSGLTEKLPVFPYEDLAEKLLGYGAVCFVAQRCLEEFSRKFKLSLRNGDFLILRHGSPAERFSYGQYEKQMEDFARKRKQELRQMLLRSAFSFGDILFYSDAKITALQENQKETLSLEERCRILQQENEELKKQVREFTQQNADMRMNSEKLRTTQKQLRTAQDDLDGMKTYCETLRREQQERESAYQQAAERVNFYRQKADLAASFPTEKDAILSWAEKQFSKNILFTQRARNSLRKFDGKPDCAIICDGILYLDAYAQFRQGSLDSETFALYSERYCWNITFCGAEALRVYNHDYLAQTADGKKYLLNMHIKYGVKVQELVRIYFCWDDALQKVILGYLPDHLPTLKDPT